MKLEVRTSGGLAAITSDQWHVVLAHLTHPGAVRPYVRTVVSEHADRASCVRSARALRRRVAVDSAGVKKADRDEVIVRRPNFKSLRVAKALRSCRQVHKRKAAPGDQSGAE